MTKRTRKTREETSLEIWAAIEAIEKGDATNIPKECTDITIKNVCLEANVSRPTLYSYPDIKEYVSNASKPTDELSVYKENFKSLESELSDLKYYVTQLEKERDLALIEQHKSQERLKFIENNLKIVK